MQKSGTSETRPNTIPKLKKQAFLQVILKVPQNSSGWPEGPVFARNWLG